jgi:hypothetical protein
MKAQLRKVLNKFLSLHAKLFIAARFLRAEYDESETPTDGFNDSESILFLSQHKMFMSMEGW